MRYIFNILLLVLPLFTFSQMGSYLAEPTDREADSLRTVYHTTSNDTIKMEVCRMLGFYYHEKNTDTALFYQLQQLELSQKLGFKLWEADALELCGFISRNMGRYPVSLQYFQKAMRVVEDQKSIKNSWRPEVLSVSGTAAAARLSVKAWIHLDLGGLFGKTKNKQKALINYRESVELAKDLNDYVLLSLGYGSIGEVFMFENELDSAMHYFELEEKYTQKSGYYKYYGSTLLNMGLTYFKRGDYEKSRTYYVKAINTSLETDNTRILGSIYLELAALFLKINLPDSSLFYARKGLHVSNETKLPQLALMAYRMLTKIFDKTGFIDSAYYYQTLSILSSDSMFSEEKIIHMQNLEFSEQLRQNELKEEHEKYQNKVRTRALLSGMVLILVVAIILYRNSRIRRKAYKLLHKQRNELQETLADLKNTQSQLVQAEKMASLGELTAGIAHEIQNPLNFINNFSEVNSELIAELHEEIEKGDLAEVKAIANDIAQNEQKISHHGKRADSIVKGMLQHSRTNTGQKELTNINALADEYLRLSYHGLRAKDKSFNAEFKTEFDPELPKIEVIPQDIGRVLLNLINNAFFAVHERSKKGETGYVPAVSITTQLTANSQQLIAIKDNGSGIPEEIKNKIFQPFFTTKPTGEGTGLGLSLSYDIVKAHGGAFKVESLVGEGTTFIITLPTS